MSKFHTPLRRKRWAAVRRAVFERDGWRCVLCGRAGRLECDHVTPLDQGGEPWDPDNLQTLCRACHVAKSRAENRRPPTEAEAAWRVLVTEIIGE